jgi:hypothetical protein
MLTLENDLHPWLLQHIEAVADKYALATSRAEKKDLVLRAAHKGLAGISEQAKANILSLLTHFLDNAQMEMFHIIALLRKTMSNPVDNNTVLRESVERFDVQFNTRTSSIVHQYEMNEEVSVERYMHSARYIPSPVNSVKELMHYLQARLDLSEYIFVDVGSGLGRNVLLASDYPFKKAMGIEISSDLHQVAQANAAAYQSARGKGKAIEFQCVSALDFAFPESNLVLYFYEPFSEDVAAQFIRNLEAHLKHKYWKVLLVFMPIVYAAAKDSTVFSFVDALTTSEKLGNSVGHFTYRIYSNRP